MSSSACWGRCRSASTAHRCRWARPSSGRLPHGIGQAPPGYRLSVPEKDCDIGRFALEKTAGVQAAAAGKFEQASRSLSAALAEWRGPVLEDLREFQFVDAFATALVHRLLPGRTPIRRAQRLPAAEDDTRRGSRHRSRADRAALYERVLRQEPLDVKRVARTTAIHTANSLDQRTAVGGRILRRPAARRVRPRISAGGGGYPDRAPARQRHRSRRPNVSRHHAVIIDTGTSFVISDLRSANGVDVRGERIRASVTLADGDRIRICDHDFTFEIQARKDADPPP